MPPTPFDDVQPPEAIRDAAAADAATWRIPRYLELVAHAFARTQDEGEPAGTPEPRRVLVIEPGHGGIGRALADRLGPEDLVVIVAGLPVDIPPAPGGELDETFVERRPHAASLDVRAATPAGWPLEPDERARFDLVVLAGGLAWIGEPGRTLEEARAALAPAGRLLVADDDPGSLHLHPPVPPFEAAWRHRLTRRSMRGRDDALVRRLPELMDRHRLTAIAGGIASHGAVTGEDDFRGVVHLLRELISSPEADPPRERAAASSPRGRLTADDDRAGPDADQAGDALERWSRRPGAVAWWPLTWVLAAHA